MYPVFHELLPCRGFRLSDLVFVVREYQIHPSAVDIDGIPEVFHSHSRAFYVPSGPSLTEFRLPVNIPVFRCPCLPQSEILHLLLRIFVLRDPRSGLQLGKIDLGKLPVFLELFYVEIYRLVISHIGVSPVHELLHQRDHLFYVISRFRVELKRLDVQRFQIIEEQLRILFSELAERDSFLLRVADGLVVDVGDVHNVFDGETAVFQVSSEYVIEQECAEVAYVGVSVNGRSARIDGSHPFLYRNKFIFLSCQGVVKT